MSKIVEIVQEQLSEHSEEDLSQGSYHFDFGHGEGINLLFNGYLEYGHYVITSRQIPNLEDGLKPVHEGLVYTEKQAYDKAKGKQGYHKSAKTVSDTMNEQHPHGDSSIYNAMARMSTSNGSSKVSLFDGFGYLGDKESENSPAAMRYTEARLAEEAVPLFDSMEGIEMVESRAGDEFQAPRVLPTKFPYAFVGMNQSGTAVGLATEVPIYDVTDVANLIIDYLKTGKFGTILEPDYTTGAYIVQNLKEFSRLMRTGRGRIKLRGHVEIKGKDIFISKLPYGITVEKLVREIESLSLTGVTAMSGTELGKTEVIVTCGRGVNPDDVVKFLYAKSSLQTYVNHVSTYQFEHRLVSVGLYEAVKLWVEWRTKVLQKKFNHQLKGIRADMEKYLPLVLLLSDKQAHQGFLSLFADLGKDESEARAYLENFLEKKVQDGSLESVSPTAIEFIMGRSLRALRSGGRYKSTYDSLVAEEKSIEAKLDNPASVIMSDMETMKSTWGVKFPRLSEVTTKDYSVVKREDVPEECTVLLKNGLLGRQPSHNVHIGNDTIHLKVMSTDTIVAGLSNGDIVATRVSDIPMGYPSMVNFPIATVGGDMHEVIFCEVAKPKTLVYLYYKTGLMSFVALDHYYNRKNLTRRLSNALPIQHLDDLADVGIFDDRAKEKIALQFNSRSISWVRFGDAVPKQSSRATTRLINFKPNMYRQVAFPENIRHSWLLDEEYHSPTTKRIRLSDQTFIFMQDYLKELTVRPAKKSEHDEGEE